MKDKIVCIIQSRIGSERLPGKVLFDLNGKSVLWHIVNRLSKSRYVDQIIIATTNLEKDNSILNECYRYNFQTFRGSEEDVLDRYYKAAIEYKAKHIVRITSDCPLIDPAIVDRVIQKYSKKTKMNHNYDYVSNFIRRSFPRGLEVEIMSISTLTSAWKNAPQIYQREHVTPYIYENSQIYNISSIENTSNLSEYRWTLDTQDDWKLISKIYSIYKNKEMPTDMNTILELFPSNPSFKNVNAQVERKEVNN